MGHTVHTQCPKLLLPAPLYVKTICFPTLYIPLPRSKIRAYTESREGGGRGVKLNIEEKKLFWLNPYKIKSHE